MILNMTSSQTGVGDREVVQRVMSRLTMAKVLNLMGHDVQNFNFYKYEPDSFSYYPYEAVMSDILEFLDAVNADYTWDEEESILTIDFDIKVKNLEHLAESITFGWRQIEEYGEFELEDIVEYLEHGLRFYLEEYDGVPLMFFIKYYELLKEKN